MTLFNKISALWRQNSEGYASVTKPTSTTDINVRILQNAAITCRCGGMAIPTAMKGNQYCCIHCDKMLTSISYNLGQREVGEDDWKISPKDEQHVIHMGCYQEAVMKIRQIHGKKTRII